MQINQKPRLYIILEVEDTDPSFCIQQKRTCPVCTAGCHSTVPGDMGEVEGGGARGTRGAER